MPKRTREQQDLHNQKRREAKQKGKQGVFTMKYISIKHPEIYTKSCEFYAELKDKYPAKRDLTTTYEFKQLKDKSTKTTELVTLEPRLNINLLCTDNNNQVFINSDNNNNNQVFINSDNNQVSTNNIEVTEQEVPFANIESMETNDIQKLIEELRQDSDLMSAFNDIMIEDHGMETIVETTVETTVEEFCPPVDKETQQIAEIVREIVEDPELMSSFNDVEFDHLGEDLPEVDDIFW